MDANSFNVNVLKEKPRIVNLHNMRGPMVAPAVSKELNLNSFLASALLSELLHDRLVKASNMKVGGGPLYYIPGQEALVENFIQYLPGKEREAFKLIKAEEIFEDSKQEPAIRVATRAIKDFAIPMKVHLDGTERLFWKLHTISREEFEKVVNYINVYGYDVTNALKLAAQKTSSEGMKELFDGLANAITSGTSLGNFLDKRAETLLLDYKLEREKYTKLAETFMNLYISIVIAAPLVLMLTLFLMSLGGLGIDISMDLISLLIVFIVAFINIIFIIFLDIKQPTY